MSDKAAFVKIIWFQPIQQKPPHPLLNHLAMTQYIDMIWHGHFKSWLNAYYSEKVHAYAEWIVFDRKGDLVE